MKRYGRCGATASFIAYYFACSRDAFEFLLAAPQPMLVDVDAKPRSFRHFDMAGIDPQWRGGNILSEPAAGHGQAPGDLRRHGGDVRRGGRGETRLAGLAGNIDLHAEPRANPARFERAA